MKTQTKEIEIIIVSTQFKNHIESEIQIPLSENNPQRSLGYTQMCIQYIITFMN